MEGDADQWPGGPDIPSFSTSGHVFISYVREDRAQVDRLHEALKSAGIRVWLDRHDLGPGDVWKVKIKKAIEQNALAFICCFSENSRRKPVSYQRQELRLAAEQYQMREQDKPWIFPVRLDECALPEVSLGVGMTLDDLGRTDLYGSERNRNLARLIDRIQTLLGEDSGPNQSLPLVSAEIVDSSARNEPSPNDALIAKERISTWGRRRKRVALLTIVMVVGFSSAVASSLWQTHWAGGDSGELPTVQGTITTPSAGADIVSPLLLQGTAHVPQDYSIWMLLSFPSDPSYYLTSDAEIKVDSASEWQLPLELGRGSCDVGTNYSVFLAAFPRSIVIEPAVAERPDGQFSVRFDTVPVYAILLDTSSFTLTSYVGLRTC